MCWCCMFSFLFFRPPYDDRSKAEHLAKEMLDSRLVDEEDYQYVVKLSQNILLSKGEINSMFPDEPEPAAEVNIDNRLTQA